MEVRSAIQQIALEHRRRYGYRRVAAELHRHEHELDAETVAKPEGSTAKDLPKE